VKIVTLSDRPDLADAMWSLDSTWPKFMFEDPVSDRLFPLVPKLFPEYQLVALDESGNVIGRVMAVPFSWGGSEDELPDRGWDAILERAIGDQNNPTAASLLEARIIPERQGEGLSSELLNAARANIQRMGIGALFGPVRPTAKSLEPRTPMRDYVARFRDDGLPADPWLRIHVRLGAIIIKICSASMTIPGTLEQWRDWTGLPFTASGLVDVPGALTPVHVSVEHDHAVYVEPNVWVHHRLAAEPRAARTL
jgi:hypothetical protein